MLRVHLCSFCMQLLPIVEFTTSSFLDSRGFSIKCSSIHSPNVWNSFTFVFHTRCIPLPLTFYNIRSGTKFRANATKLMCMTLTKLMTPTLIGWQLSDIFDWNMRHAQSTLRCQQRSFSCMVGLSTRPFLFIRYTKHHIVEGHVGPLPKLWKTPLGLYTRWCYFILGSVLLLNENHCPKCPLYIFYPLTYLCGTQVVVGFLW